MKSRKECPAGHPQEASWDVCPYCAKGTVDLSETRVHDGEHTLVVGTSHAGLPAVGWLVALSGTHRGITFSLREGKNCIGSDGSCEVRILDEGVSESHARIEFELAGSDGTFYLMDTDSTNGTFLNEAARPVEREEIVDNDLIRFGRTDTIFKSLPRGAIGRLRS